MNGRNISDDMLLTTLWLKQKMNDLWCIYNNNTYWDNRLFALAVFGDRVQNGIMTPAHGLVYHENHRNVDESRTASGQ